MSVETQSRNSEKSGDRLLRIAKDCHWLLIMIALGSGILLLGKTNSSSSANHFPKNLPLTPEHHFSGIYTPPFQNLPSIDKATKKLREEHKKWLQNNGHLPLKNTYFSP